MNLSDLELKDFLLLVFGNNETAEGKTFAFIPIIIRDGIPGFIPNMTLQVSTLPDPIFTVTGLGVDAEETTEDAIGEWINEHSVEILAMNLSPEFRTIVEKCIDSKKSAA